MPHQRPKRPRGLQPTSGVSPADHGEDSKGAWVDPSRMQEVVWAGRDEHGIWEDPSRAQYLLGRDSNGSYIER